MFFGNNELYKNLLEAYRAYKKYNKDTPFVLILTPCKNPRTLKKEYELQLTELTSNLYQDIVKQKYKIIKVDYNDEGSVIAIWCKRGFLRNLEYIIYKIRHKKELDQFLNSIRNKPENPS